MASPGLILNAKYAGHPYVPLYVRNNAPTSGQYTDACPFGGLVLDMVAGIIYQNTGTISATVWTIFGSTLAAATSATALPTADPHVVGRLWTNSGVVTVSAG